MNTSKQQAISILEVSASGRHEDSVSRMLTRDIVNALESRYEQSSTRERDVAAGVELVDDSWIAANFTDAAERSDAQRERLKTSDALVEELQQADVIVIGAPIYNFGIPAALKAWIDMITRARLTFRHTASGPEGLLKNKKAYVVVASGGVPVDSPVDFATPYLRQALGFVGITDVEVIAADQLGQDADAVINAARARIADLIHEHSTQNNRAA